MKKESLKSKTMAWADAWNKRDLDAADYFFSDDFIYHGTSRDWNLLELKDWYLDLTNQYGNIKVNIDNLVCEDEKIAITWTLTHNRQEISKGGGVGAFSNGRLIRFRGVTTDQLTFKQKTMAWVDAWNRRDLNAADDYFTDDFIYQGTTKQWNLAELKTWYLNLVDKHRDVKVYVDDLVCTEDKIGINWTLKEGNKVISKGGGVGSFSNKKLTSFTGVTTD